MEDNKKINISIQAGTAKSLWVVLKEAYETPLDNISWEDWMRAAAVLSALAEIFDPELDLWVEVKE